MTHRTALGGRKGGGEHAVVPGCCTAVLSTAKRSSHSSPPAAARRSPRSQILPVEETRKKLPDMELPGEVGDRGRGRAGAELMHGVPCRSGGGS